MPKYVFNPFTAKFDLTLTSGDVEHGLTTGLSDDDHTQYALLAGRSGGQVLYGDTASNGTLKLESTSNATKGTIIMAETDDEVAIGLTSPNAKLHIKNNVIGANDAPSGDDDNGYTVANAPIQNAFFERGFVGLGSSYFTPKNRLDVRGGMAIGPNYAGTYASPNLDGLLVEGNVSIGTFTNGSRVNIRGSGATSATSALNVSNSAGTSILFVRNDGRVGIGTTSPESKLHVLHTISSNAVQYAGISELDFTSTANNLNESFGFAATIRFKGTSGNDSADNKGLSAFSFNAFNSNTGTVDYMQGMYGDARNLSSGTVTNFSGIRLPGGVNSGGGTITNFYGLLIEAQSVGTNRYALSLNNAAATNVYNVYAGGTAQNYFAGNVGIGTTSPTAARLQILGNSSTNQSIASYGKGNGGGYDATISSGFVAGIASQPFVNVTGNSSNIFGNYSFAGVNVETGVTLTNLYGFFIDVPSKTGSGTMTNAYGLYVNGPTVGTNNVAAYFGGNVGIGDTTPAAQLHVDQTSTTAAIPTLRLQQADLSEEFIRFDTTVGTGNPINTTAEGTYYGRVRVWVEGVGARWISLHNA